MFLVAGLCDVSGVVSNVLSLGWVDIDTRGKTQEKRRVVKLKRGQPGSGLSCRDVVKATAEQYLIIGLLG